MEHVNTLCVQNAEFKYVKAGGTYSNHWALKGQKWISRKECKTLWERNL
jgi:hypothetical protein